jgi:hypothetical protein
VQPNPVDDIVTLGVQAKRRVLTFQLSRLWEKGQTCKELKHSDVPEAATGKAVSVSC